MPHFGPKRMHSQRQTTCKNKSLPACHLNATSQQPQQQRQLWSRPLRKGSLADAHKAEAAAAKKVNSHDVATRKEVRCTAIPESTFPGTG